MNCGNPREVSLEWVRAHPLFQDLSPRDLEVARALLRVETVDEAAQLVTPGQVGKSLYLVRRGAFKVAAWSENREMILALHGPNAVFDDFRLLGDDEVRVVAKTASEVAVLNRFDFWNTLWPMRALPFNVMNLLATRARAQNAQILAMGTLDVRFRLVRQLALLVRQHGFPLAGGALELSFPCTQEELACMIGTSRVHTSQVLKNWKGGTVVSFTRGRVVVNLPDELFGLAEQVEELLKQNAPAPDDA